MSSETSSCQLIAWPGTKYQCHAMPVISFSMHRSLGVISSTIHIVYLLFLLQKPAYCSKQNADDMAHSCLQARISISPNSAKEEEKKGDKFCQERFAWNALLVSMAIWAAAAEDAQRKIEGWTLHVQDEEWIPTKGFKVLSLLRQVKWRLDNIYDT